VRRFNWQALAAVLALAVLWWSFFLATRCDGGKPRPTELVPVERPDAQLKGASPAQHLAALRRQNSAQQRYLQAVKALAAVRKLLRPTPSPLDPAMRPVAERPAGRLAGAAAPADGEPVLN
jgi:hypothetical protein